VAVVHEAYIHGVSTRTVDDLVKALGIDGVSTRQVSRRCAELDATVEQWRAPRLAGRIRTCGSMPRSGRCGTAAAS
jgi:putative transposase